MDHDPFMSAGFPTIKELGCPGHFIGADRCLWRRHTLVGDHIISSIGNYMSPTSNKFQTVGGGVNDFFETMVFPAGDFRDSNGCGCREPVDVGNPLKVRRYKTEGEAQRGHEQCIEEIMEAYFRKLGGEMGFSDS